jgi:cytochrome c-type protein NapB
MRRPGRIAFAERGMSMVALGVLVVCGIGFLIGTNDTDDSGAGFQFAPAPADGSATHVAPAARSYEELARNPWGSGPSASWSATSAALVPTPELGAELERPSRSEPALLARAARRAFDGAPPVIPHPVTAGGVAECLACHESGLMLGELRARPMPHAAFTSCTQCHVTEAAAPPVDGERRTVGTGSDFTPLESPRAGVRAWAGAPPAIPHSTQLRERCLACHGLLGRAGMRSPHPQRTSCLQCHALTTALQHRGAGS